VKFPYVLLPSADRDLELQADYLAEAASIEIALRFLTAAHETFCSLAKHPRMGWRPSLGPAFRSIRAFRVMGFEKILIFYRPGDGVLEIVRILHGARDLEALFAEEPPDEPRL